MQEPPEFDIDESMGPELFPTCECYTTFKHAKDNRRFLHDVAHMHATAMLAAAEANNQCGEAVIHIAALTIHSLVGLVANIECSNEGVGDDEAGRAVYCAKMRDHQEKIKTLLDRLQARAHRILLAEGKGADVVQ